MKVKLTYQNKTIDVDYESFAKKLSHAMKEIASSNVFFIMQQAYGEIDYSECEKIWEAILNHESLKTINKKPCKMNRK